MLLNCLWGAGQVCADDIEAVCGYERDSLDTVEGFDARVIQCLQVRAHVTRLQNVPSCVVLVLVDCSAISTPWGIGIWLALGLRVCLDCRQRVVLVAVI